MFYQFLRLVIFVAIKIFFRSAHIRNLEQIPKKGGLILAANHPSTFLDPLVLAVWLRRPVCFLTNGGVFKNAFLKWFLKQFYMVPIYRKQDSNASANKNEEAFVVCYEMLAAGGALVIFPEGGSENERKLRKIKTGLARIVLGAEAKYDFQLEIKIVCAGINYTNPRKFQSELFVQYALPFSVANYKEIYENNPQQAVHELTAEVETKLRSLIVFIEDKEDDEFVRKIEVLYSHHLQDFLELPIPQTEQVFMVAQHFADAVRHFQQNAPQRMALFKQKTLDYFAKLQTYNIQDKTVASYQAAKNNIWGYLPYLILVFPLYLLGLLHNFIPYQLPAWISLKLTKDATFLGAFNFGLGIICFSSFYLAYGYIFLQFVPSYVLLFLYYCLIATAGFISYYYWHFIKRVKERSKIDQILQKEPNLLAMRHEIIAELEKSRDEYILFVENSQNFSSKNK
jgi:glycerol-3-phosphate O-acyltransferase / dihydroxyacetone phosphate acyltransferase